MFLRFSANDTDLLDQCSLCDPRTKSLIYLSAEKKNKVQEYALQRMMSNGDDDDGSEFEVQDEPVPEQSAPESDTDLLSTLLAEYQTPAPASSNPLKDEFQRYINDPGCDFSKHPLEW